MAHKIDNLKIPTELNYTIYRSCIDRVADRFHQIFHLTAAPSLPHPYTQFLGAWNGILYRSIALAKFDDAFTKSVRKYGTSPRMAQRCEQDNLLLSFFVCGLSAFESTFYGLYAVGSLLKPNDFTYIDRNNSDKLKKINPVSTADAFEKAYDKDALTIHLRDLVGKPDKKIPGDPQYEQWSNIRNVLTHRTVPGRIHFSGGARHGQTHLKDVLMNDVLEFDEYVTSKRRQWFFEQINDLLSASDGFIQEKLEVSSAM